MPPLDVATIDPARTPPTPAPRRDPAAVREAVHAAEVAGLAVPPAWRALVASLHCRRTSDHGEPCALDADHVAEGPCIGAEEAAEIEGPWRVHAKVRLADPRPSGIVGETALLTPPTLDNCQPPDPLGRGCVQGAATTCHDCDGAGRYTNDRGESVECWTCAETGVPIDAHARRCGECEGHGVITVDDGDGHTCDLPCESCNAQADSAVDLSDVPIPTLEEARAELATIGVDADAMARNMRARVLAGLAAREAAAAPPPAPTEVERLRARVARLESAADKHAAEIRSERRRAGHARIEARACARRMEEAERREDAAHTSARKMQRALERYSCGAVERRLRADIDRQRRSLEARHKETIALRARVAELETAAPQWQREPPTRDNAGEWWLWSDEAGAAIGGTIKADEGDPSLDGYGPSEFASDGGWFLRLPTPPTDNA